MCVNGNYGLQMKIIFANDNCQPQMLKKHWRDQNETKIITV